MVSGSQRPGLRPGNSVAGTSRCRPVSFQRLAGRAAGSTSDSGARFRIPSPRWWLWDGGVRRAGSVGATSRTIDSIIARRLWPLQSRPVVCRCSPATTGALIDITHIYSFKTHTSKYKNCSIMYVWLTILNCIHKSSEDLDTPYNNICNCI